MVADAYAVLASDEWLDWNARTWRLRPLLVEYGSADSVCRLRGVLYLNRHGRVTTPPLNPYLPFALDCSESVSDRSKSVQWLELASMFAEELKGRGSLGRVLLPPMFTDARAFSWAGLAVEVRYTYQGSLPYDMSAANRAVRRGVSRAEKRGYRVEPVASAADVVSCLTATADRNNFEYRLTTGALENAMETLGDARLMMHAVKASDGSVVSAGGRLVSEGGMALDWVQGTRDHALADGVAQLMYRTVLDEAAGRGATAFDFGGANLRAVAESKARWGVGLVPYLAVRQWDTRLWLEAARQAKRQWTTRRNWSRLERGRR